MRERYKALPGTRVRRWDDAIVTPMNRFRHEETGKEICKTY